MARLRLPEAKPQQQPGPPPAPCAAAAAAGLQVLLHPPPQQQRLAAPLWRQPVPGLAVQLLPPGAHPAGEAPPAPAAAAATAAPLPAAALQGPPEAAATAAAKPGLQAAVAVAQPARPLAGQLLCSPQPCRWALLQPGRAPPLPAAAAAGRRRRPGWLQLRRPPLLARSPLRPQVGLLSAPPPRRPPCQGPGQRAGGRPGWRCRCCPNRCCRSTSRRSGQRLAQLGAGDQAQLVARRSGAGTASQQCRAMQSGGAEGLQRESKTGLSTSPPRHTKTRHFRRSAAVSTLWKRLQVHTASERRQRGAAL